ncbi:MAG: single-stranded-DNA-specific exonuclease RecJ [Candidatus Eisenbacteria bacterium]
MPPSVTVSSNWVLHPRRSEEAAQRLVRVFGAPLPVAHAMVNRGIDTDNKVQSYLEPSIEDLHDPAEMLDLEKAAERILSGISRSERIFIQGDYDVDGITSTFLLYSALLELGAAAEYRIPHRIKDGYGLTNEAIDEARRRGCTLVVTVDCGITAVEAVAHATALGIETVITDHHEPPAQLPAAYAIINPLRPGCPYPFKALAGVGVTFKLVERLLESRGGLDRARDYLDVVALGTIADVVPLVGENRVLARLGLDRLNENKRLGLAALIDKVKLSGKRISSGQVAFVLAPRINAAGRMGNAEQGLRLLLSRESHEAADIAASLEEDNDARRKLDERALRDAERRVTEELGYPNCSSITLWSEEWHQGVIGIVASRLVERFQRPTVLVTLEGERGRGSGRSLPGLDLTKLLDGCHDLLLAHGGHAFAAGLTVERSRLPELRERLEKLTREQYQPDQFTTRLELDAEVLVSECSFEMVEWLERMTPHGLDNPEPVFHIHDAQLLNISTVGAGKHVRFTVRDGTGEVEAIGFGMGDLKPALLAAGRADLAFVPTINTWNDQQRVQLKLKGVRIP